MRMSVETAINKLAERTTDQHYSSSQAKLQRRDQVVDVYGLEFTRQGDTNNPATFYISTSKDLRYFQRFEFKIIVQAFVMPVGEGGMLPVKLEVDETDWTINGASVSPNPHSHKITPETHTHALAAGISVSDSVFSDFEIWIEGIDITPYLKAQYDGDWITGDGVYPKGADDMDNYDILKIIGFMPSWQQGVILRPGYKKMEIKANGIFNVTIVQYVKYSHGGL